MNLVNTEVLMVTTDSIISVSVVTVARVRINQVSVDGLYDRRDSNMEARIEIRGTS